MGLTCRVDAKDGYVVLELTGQLSKDECKSVAEESGRLVLEKWTDTSVPLRLLIDYRGMTGIPSKGRAHFIIANEWWSDKKMRIAWLYQEARNDGYFRYLETTSRQYGYSTRAFRDEEKAVRWLTAS